MKVMGIIKNETTPKVTTGETMFTVTGSDYKRGGGYCLVYRKRTSTRCLADGNGEMQDTELHGRSDEDTDREE